MIKEFFKNLFRKKTKIDRLARYKNNLILEKDGLERAMRERNSKRETKIALLTNAAQNDYEKTNKRIKELELQIAKAIRDIDSEQTYVNEVANGEKVEHQKYLEEEKERKTYKGGVDNE